MQRKRKNSNTDDYDGSAIPPVRPFRVPSLQSSSQDVSPPNGIVPHVPTIIPEDYCPKSAKYHRRLRRVKAAARSELNSDSWHRLGLCAHNFWPKPAHDTVPRIDHATTTTEMFITRFEAPAVPVVITGCTDAWPARVNWTLEALARSHHREKFKVGEDDEGDPVCMRLNHFLRYSVSEEARRDDSPLYIFDAVFGDRRVPNSAKRLPRSDPEPPSPSVSAFSLSPPKREKERPRKLPSNPTSTLLADYSIPSYFADDLFNLTGTRRPPHRWFVLGPARSGTGLHIDPLGTSAWNALIHGHKRWCLFPPTVPRSVVKPRGLPDNEASTWFHHVYPSLQAGRKALGMVEILQRAGETVFVPGGWWHVVMNLDWAVAVTQNFCSPTNFPYVWHRLRFSRPGLAQKLLRRLAARPKFHGLLDVALQLATTPRVEASSSSSSSTETSVTVGGTGDDTVSERSEGGRCMCRKCKIRRKKKVRDVVWGGADEEVVTTNGL